MAFLNTLDNGQYSPTLCIRTGVNFSVETMPYNSGKTDTNPLINQRVRGNYDYMSRFPGGFFNFENYYPTVNTPSIFPTELRVYSIDGQFSGIQKQYTDKVTGIYQHNSPSIVNYWNSSTNVNTIAQSGIRRYSDLKNFVNVMPLMINDNFGINENITAEGNVYLNVLGSAMIAQGPNYVGAAPNTYFYGPKADLTIYGRFRINSPNTPIAVFGSNFNLFPANGGSGVSPVMTIARNYLEIVNDKFKLGNISVLNGTTPGAFTNGVDNVSRASGFYQFIYCFSQYGSTAPKTYGLLYEGDDSKPLRLTFSGILTSQYSTGLKAFYSGVTLLAQQSGVIWSEFGVDNRLWGLNDVLEFNRTRLYPSSFIDDSPTLLPVDNDYLNFHFPVNSVGTLGATNSGDYMDTGYTVTLQPSGLSPYIYEFDRSEFNPTALRLRTIMQSISNNPSGHLQAKIEFDGQNKYWKSYPVLVPNTKSEVLMSGQVYDLSGNSLDLTEVVASGISGSRLKFGAWYDDNGSSWGGDINLYSAKAELDSWVIPQPSAIADAVTLNMKAGVVYCKQTLAAEINGINPSVSLLSSRIHGNFDYSKFECGYYNFENTPLETTPAPITQFPLYSYDYRFGGTLFMPPNNDFIFTKPFITDWNRQRGHQNIISATRNVENFSTVIMASGNANFTLMIPNSGDLLLNNNRKNISIYGRFRIPSFYVNEYPIATFNENNNNSFNTISIRNGKIRFTMQKDVSAGGYTSFEGQDTLVGDFYSFMLVQDRGTTNQCLLYESYNSEPLRLRNITTNESFNKWFSDDIGTSFYGAPLGGTEILWTDFGISNRAWTTSDIAEFENTKFYPGFYISENPYSTLPPPSGLDSTYLNFHFPLNSSGNLSLTHRDDGFVPLNGTGFYIPIASGLSKSLFEFDRSEFNSSALKVDMWVDNISNNPSGNIVTKVNFPNLYWQSNDTLIPNNGPVLVSMSGQFFDYSNNPKTMSDITFLDSSENLQLGMGAWYNNINIPYSGDINIYSARIYMDAYCTVPQTGNVLPLYTNGEPIARAGLDLFVQNAFISESVDLYINGYSSLVSGCDLYIAGGFNFKDTTLFINGRDTLVNDTTLFIEGSTIKGNMPLYIYSQPPSQMSGNLPLSIWATSNPTNSKVMSLFIGENAPSGIKTGGMNLYAIGPQSERVTASMNLFMKRDLYDDKSSVTLFCRNELTSLEGQVTLFMSAPSGTLGAVPVSGQMNLYMARTEGIQDGFDLFVSGPEGVEDGIPMVIDGGPPVYSSMPLITDGIGVDYNTLKVYINGF